MKRKIFLILIVFLFNILWVNALDITNKLASHYNFVIKTTDKSTLNNNPNIIDEIDIMTNPNLVFENESADTIGKKINLYLKEELAGYGDLISRYAIINNVNPYLIASMIIEETHCDFKCSVLVTKCNNVYEAIYNKDSLNQAACFEGYYQKFDTIDASIKSFIKYVKVEFYEHDLKTPNSIYKKYNKDVRWAFIVNQYMDQIKKSIIN